MTTFTTPAGHPVAADKAPGAPVDENEHPDHHNDLASSVNAAVAYLASEFGSSDPLVASDVGTSVQAHSSVLDATTASFTTADETKLDGIEAGADVSIPATLTPVSGYVYPLFQPATDLTNGSFNTVGRMWAVPFTIHHAFTCDGLSIVNQTSIFGFGDMGIYTDGGGFPHTYLDHGLFSAIGAGLKTVAIDIEFTPGVYWFVFRNESGNKTFRCINHASNVVPMSMPLTSLVDWSNAFFQSASALRTVATTFTDDMATYTTLAVTDWQQSGLDLGILFALDVA